MAYNPMMYYPNYYQQPAYQPMPQPQPQQMASPRMVEVVPVDTVEAAKEFPVAIGATLMMIAKDDSFLAIKVNGVNGQSSFEVYDKRPPAPPVPSFDPEVYVTKDELESRLAALTRRNSKVKEADAE